nr:hypothetical protein [Bacillus vallismortis]
MTARALRRNINSGEDFPEQLEELRNYFKPSGNVRNQVRAIPGEGVDVPIWLLGSSGFSARLAGELGLPFAFAAHFSPANTVPALELYRNSFTPSEVLDETVCNGWRYHYRGRYKRESAAPCDIALPKIS